MSDKTIRDRILAELDWDPSIEATDIGVAIEDGVVTLTGHVATYAEKMSVESAVKRVKGVRAIAQEVEIRTSLSSKMTDDQIAKRAADVIDWDVTIPRGKVTIKVQNGYVTLSGEVDWQYQRRHAEEAVRTLTGVRGINNTIALKARVSVPDIQKRIESALQRNAALEAKAIKVSVADGRVTLEGEVDDWTEREAVETAVWAAPGVTTVVDHLRIH
ncbi:BON domain-containing protein [Henriciella sp.]|uniref:BON domain-containing protein n=1 Tax=Henriciella sp. TaxID=1968823 RepID=UPI00260C9461|nr:BON domain-containing protein [Henriciella sp.]